MLLWVEHRILLGGLVVGTISLVETLVVTAPLVVGVVKGSRVCNSPLTVLDWVGTRLAHRVAVRAVMNEQDIALDVVVPEAASLPGVKETQY